MYSSVLNTYKQNTVRGSVRKSFLQFYNISVFKVSESFKHFAKKSDAVTEYYRKVKILHRINEKTVSCSH